MNCNHRSAWMRDGRCMHPECLRPLPDPTVNAVKNSRRARHTSLSASQRAWPKSGTQRAQVLMAIANKPSTDDELTERLGIRPNSQRPRRVELEEAGWIEDSGIVRSTPTGNDAIVWRLTAKAQSELGVSV